LSARVSQFLRAVFGSPPGRLAVLIAWWGASHVPAQDMPMTSSPWEREPSFRQYDPRRLTIFFPPNPPPLGAEIVRPDTVAAPSPRRGVSRPTPTALGAFVTDLFYAPLSTRLTERDLSDRQKQRVLAYRNAKVALGEELGKRLDALPSAPPEDRRAELEALARTQAPRLAELDRTADQLRNELFNPGFFADVRGDGDWYELREWRLGKGRLAKPRDETLVYEMQLLRAAAFYQEGLSPAQRRLLREIAMELEERLLIQKEEEPAPTALRFFSPEMARVSLPEDLPRDLAARFGEFDREKTAVKDRLRDTLYEQDKAFLAMSRTRVLRTLAQEQAPRLEALDRMAEDIRRNLVGRVVLPVFPAPRPLPSAVVKAIGAFNEEGRAMQTELTKNLQEFVNKLPGPAGFRDRAAAQAYVAERNAKIRAEAKRLEQGLASRVAAQEKLLIRVRDDIVRFAGDDPATVAGKPPGDYLRKFFEARQQQLCYHHYHLAVWEPGLSAEQRRLLFDQAIEELRLPLPGGELQPVEAAGMLIR
jgi:hypothetical protein